MTLFYAVLVGSEWEDIQYFASEHHALMLLQRLGGAASVHKYECEDGRIFKWVGVYSVKASGPIVYDDGTTTHSLVEPSFTMIPGGGNDANEG